MTKETRILITGDFCPVNRVNELILNKHYDRIFNDFLPFIKRADLAITNLECPLTNSTNMISKIGPLMKADVTSAEALDYAGFKLVTLANNHVMDFGASGLGSTIEACKNIGLNYVGAGEDHKMARKFFLAKVGEWNIAVLNYAENEFSTTTGNSPGANPFDLINAYYDILTAKTVADYTFVIIHGGNELYNLPSPRIKKAFHYFADIGADAVFAHHSHCYSGYEVYNNVPVFYGLGNFVFDKPDKKNVPWNYGCAVEIIINGSLTYNLIPYSQCNDNVGIKVLSGQLKEEFFEKIAQLNFIIANDQQLEKRFNNYCKNMRRMYSSFLEPHSIGVIHFLRNRNLFPSFLSRKKRTLYLNLIRCESHRDVLIDLLGSSLSNKSLEIDCY